MGQAILALLQPFKPSMPLRVHGLHRSAQVAAEWNQALADKDRDIPHKAVLLIGDLINNAWFPVRVQPSGHTTQAQLQCRWSWME